MRDTWNRRDPMTDESINRVTFWRGKNRGGTFRHFKRDSFNCGFSNDQKCNAAEGFLKNFRVTLHRLSNRLSVCRSDMEQEERRQ